MIVNEKGEIVLQRKTDMDMLVRIDERVENISVTIGKIETKITDYNNIKTDVMWLKKFFWILATGVFGGLITSVFAILSRR